MNVAMIKHKKSDKIYWFEVPDRIASVVTPGSLVICDTARGKDFGTVIGSVLDADDVKDIMVTSGARFPLRKIDSINTASPVKVQMDLIKIPSYMARTTPHDEKLAKRFLEIYRTGKFNTDVLIDNENTLVDGYSAYLVAKFLGLNFLSAHIVPKKRGSK